MRGGFSRALVVAGAAALVLGSGVTAAAAGAAFVGTIDPGCVVPGQQVTVRLSGLTDVAVIRLSYGVSAAGGGSVATSQTGGGLADAARNFSQTFSIPSTATAGTGSVLVFALSPNAPAETGEANFAIGADPGACPSPATVFLPGSNVGVIQVSLPVSKTCDAGVSGTAVFSLSMTMGALPTVGLPSGANLRLPCNGAPQLLLGVPEGTQFVLHEETPPPGAVPAPDTHVVISSNTEQLVIHNASAASTATPTPTPTGAGTRVLAQTGAGESVGSSALWLAVVLGVVLLMVGSTLLHHRSPRGKGRR